MLPRTPATAKAAIASNAEMRGFIGIVPDTLEERCPPPPGGEGNGNVLECQTWDAIERLA